MKPIDQMTLKELKKAEMDLSEDLHFKDQRNEKISQEERNELYAIRSRLIKLDPPKYSDSELFGFGPGLSHFND